jgi:hypothetical protein
VGSSDEYEPSEQTRKLSNIIGKIFLTSSIVGGIVAGFTHSPLCFPMAATAGLLLHDLIVMDKSDMITTMCGGR